MGKIQKKLKPHLYGKNSEVAETCTKKDDKRHWYIRDAKPFKGDY